MILENGQFRQGLEKCIGIVKDQGNLDNLKSFYLKPDIENGKVYLAGSDGSIYFLDKIDAVYEEDDTDEVIILPSSKLFPIVKNVKEQIVIKNHADSAAVSSGNRKWTVQKIREDYVDVPFECFDVTDFDDELDAQEFLFIIERLAGNISNPSDPNPTFRQLYIDGDKAFSSTATFATIAKFQTAGQYILKEKVVRSIRDILRGYDGPVKITFAEDEVTVIVRTQSAVLVYKHRDSGRIDDIDAMDGVQLENAIVLVRNDLANLVAYAKITSGNGRIDIHIAPEDQESEEAGHLDVHSEDKTGEDFEGSVEIKRSKRSAISTDKEKENAELAKSARQGSVKASESLIDETTFSVSVEDFQSAIGIIKSEFVILRYSTVGEDYLSISDDRNTYRSIMVTE